MTAPVASCAGRPHAEPSLRRSVKVEVPISPMIPGTNVGATDPFGDIAHHARSEFVDGISADVVRVRSLR